MNLGGNLDVLGTRVSMVRADHSSSIATPEGLIYGGIAAGYVVRLPGGYTFYHAGDTALFSDMDFISELYRPELAFCRSAISTPWIHAMPRSPVGCSASRP